MGMFYTHTLGDKFDSHILQYHLECLALDKLQQSGLGKVPVEVTSLLPF